MFLIVEKVWQVWSCSKSWCIPNYQLLVSFKTHHFCLISEEFENKFLNQKFYGQLPEQAWSNGLFDFSKSCPSGCQVFQMIPKWRKVFIKMDWLLTMITNPFKIPIIQNLETFSFFFQNKTSSYFEKETEWEIIFWYFF